MKWFVLLILSGLLVACGSTPIAPAKTDMTKKESVQAFTTMQAQQQDGVKTTESGIKATDDLKVTIDSMTPINVETKKEAAQQQVTVVRDYFGEIKKIFADSLTTLTKTSKLNDDKDRTIAALQKKVQQLEEDSNSNTKKLIGLVAGISFLAIIGFGIFLALAANKKTPLMLLGCAVIAFCLSIAALKFFLWLVWGGLFLIIVATALVGWRVYVEIKKKTSGLDAVVATVDVLKQNIDPTKVSNLMNNVVTAIQHGSQDVITEARARITEAKKSTD